MSGASIPALLQKFRDGKALTPKEQEWVMEELERLAAKPITTSLTDTRDDAITDIHDVVSFTMPPTVSKGAYELNMRSYQGACQAEHHAYLMLLRMHQNDILAYRELFEARGDQEGLRPYIVWQAPTVPCRLVRRAERNAEGQCVKCETLRQGAKRVAA